MMEQNLSVPCRMKHVCTPHSGEGLEVQWLSSPSCQRGSYAFYKSVSCRAQPDGPLQVWKLGEFYCIRCGPQEPVCIAEVTLLWEEQGQRHLLASSRLYFLPEDTPKGRSRDHGEDEVLAVCKRIVVRVEDLVRWSCSEPVGWRNNKRPSSESESSAQNDQSGSDASPDETSHPLRVQSNAPAGHHRVKVLSYPQYCRFRSLQRRIQDTAGLPALEDPHLLALGGLRVALSDTRVMYCRETFSHPTLDSSSSLWPHFRCPSLSLRGRPRKKRSREGKDSPTLSRSQSESWMKKMKENVMGDLEMSPERVWLPHPEEQLFLDQLFVFMDRCGQPINKVPNLGFKKIDLFLMFSVVQRLGGYEKVTTERLWKVVYNELGGCPGSTSAATCTRRHYERLMLPYEDHVRAGGARLKLPEPPSPPKFRAIRGRKPLPRGRKSGAKAKERNHQPPQLLAPPAVSLDGTMTAVVKRGRGRPPGRRNKATLLAQAKLLAQQQAKAKAAVTSSTPTLPAPGLQHMVQGPSPQPPLAQPPAHMPLTPDLSPMTAPLLPFQAKPGHEIKLELGDPAGPPTVATSPGCLLPTPPSHTAGGFLGPFSPSKGLCPLDTFRTRLGLQPAAESPAAHQPAVESPQSKVESCPQPPPHQHNHQPCSGCVVDDGSQKEGGKEGKSRPPLPPLRVFPLDLDCSVQVCQLMRTRLGTVQLQSFTRRLSEVLSHDLKAKPPLLPCSPVAPITPPPEQSQPLNLSQRSSTKRPPDSEQMELLANGIAPASAKRPRGESLGWDDGGELGPHGRSVPGEGGRAGLEAQEEPADLSSPSRIRAFLMGLPPPFHVKLEEDLDKAGLATSLPAPPPGNSLGVDKEEAEGEPEPGASGEDRKPSISAEDGDGTTSLVTTLPPLEEEEAGEKGEGENSVSVSGDRDMGPGGLDVAGGKVEELRCDVDFPTQGLSRTLLPPALTQHS